MRDNSRWVIDGNHLKNFPSLSSFIEILNLRPYLRIYIYSKSLLRVWNQTSTWMYKNSIVSKFLFLKSQLQLPVKHIFNLIKLCKRKKAYVFYIIYLYYKFFGERKLIICFFRKYFDVFIHNTKMFKFIFI